MMATSVSVDGRTSSKGFYNFGPDDAINTLPRDMQACLGRNKDPMAGCDAIMGSVFSGSGYCGDPKYAGMSYCACVNSAIPCPMVAFNACANSATAYLPGMMMPDTPQTKICQEQSVCINEMITSGPGNTINNSHQSCNFGESLKAEAQLHPTLAILLVLVLLTELVYFAVWSTTAVVRGARRLTAGRPSASQN